tara:strand:+ start:19460 stop:20995 length:1536 start_codon:yes stop_codon:yes gene_type:complete
VKINSLKKLVNSNFRGVSKNLLSFMVEKPRFLKNNYSKKYDKKDVWYFNSSSHLDFMSLFSTVGNILVKKLSDEGYSVTTLQCEGGPVFCQTGASVLNPNHMMPCYSCIKFNRKFTDGTHPIVFSKNDRKNKNVEILSDDEIKSLIEPSIRWLLRGNTSDEKLYKSFQKNMLLSSKQWINYLNEMPEGRLPKFAIIFNGYTFPESIIKKVLELKNVKVFTFESGFANNSIFFSEEFAPDYNFKIRKSKLKIEEKNKLEEYLQKRRTGEFDRGGVKFWKEMEPISKDLIKKIKEYKNTASLFLNVPFDTSQVNAHYLFEDLYDWLLSTKKLVKENPSTLFIYRSHPDESREDKKLFQPTSEWLVENGFSKLKNVVIISSENNISSYELIKISDLVLVYNSTVALESVLLNKNVLTAGNAHYTRINYFKPSKNKDKYFESFKKLLNQKHEIPNNIYSDVEQYFYSLVFESSIDFSNEITKTENRKYSFETADKLNLKSKSLNEFMNFIQNTSS